MRADVDYDGGITGVMKLAHVAEGLLGMDLEIHAPGQAPRHCMSAVRNTNYYELGLVNPKVAGWKSQHQVHADDYSRRSRLRSTRMAACRCRRGRGSATTSTGTWIRKARHRHDGLDPKRHGRAEPAAGGRRPPRATTAGKWALLQRRIFDVLNVAAIEFADRYTRDDGTLIWRDEWPGMDGSGRPL